MGQGTLREVQDGSGRSKTSTGTLGEERYGSEDHWGGLGWDGGPSAMFGTGPETLGEVRDGSGDSRGCPEQVGGPL